MCLCTESGSVCLTKLCLNKTDECHLYLWNKWLKVSECSVLSGVCINDTAKFFGEKKHFTHESWVGSVYSMHTKIGT